MTRPSPSFSGSHISLSHYTVSSWSLGEFSLLHVVILLDDLPLELMFILYETKRMSNSHPVEPIPIKGEVWNTSIVGYKNTGPSVLTMSSMFYDGTEGATGGAGGPGPGPGPELASGRPIALPKEPE